MGVVSWGWMEFVDAAGPRQDLVDNSDVHWVFERQT